MRYASASVYRCFVQFNVGSTCTCTYAEFRLPPRFLAFSSLLMVLCSCFHALNSINMRVRLGRRLSLRRRLKGRPRRRLTASKWQLVFEGFWRLSVMVKAVAQHPLCVQFVSSLISNQPEFTSPRQHFVAFFPTSAFSKCYALIEF